MFQQFLKTKAAKHGHQCPQCGGNDGNFALNGKCNICKAPMIRYGKELRLLFSLEAFLEFIDHYCKQGSIFEKMEVRELMERILAGVRENVPKVNTEEIEELQVYFKSGYKIEELSGNYVIQLNPIQTDMSWYHEPHETGWDFKGLIGALMVIQFLTVVKI